MIKFRKHRKLKTEYLLNSIITITLLFVVVIAVVVGLNIKMYQNEIYFKNGLVSKSLTLQLDEHSLNQIRAIENFSFYHEDESNLDEKVINRRLDNFLSYDDMFIRFQILDSSGILTHTTSNDKSNIGLDFSQQPYISVLDKSGDYFYSNTFFSKEYNRVLASLSYKSDSNYYITYLDLSHFTEHIDLLPIKDQLEYILLDHNGTIVSSSIKDLVETRSKFSFYIQNTSLINNYDYVTIKDIKYLMNDSFSNSMKWTIIILNDSSEIFKPIYRMVVISLAVSVAMIVVIFIFQYRRINYIINKINELNINLALIEKGVYDVVFLDTQFVEFNELATHFKKSTDEIQLREDEIKSLNTNLESIVGARTSELSDKNEELEALITELQDTQNLLLESEKIASFSRLIAGIAHEINTPIGVCITMSSYLIEASKKLEKAYENKELTSRQFKEYLDKITEISGLLLDNLMKSGDLITSFKNASSNNFTYDLCEYNLYELTNNLVKSLNTLIKNKDIIIDINIEENFTLISYPSAMSQILTNLISNSITHGFKDRSDGRIVISATKDGDKVLLIVEDNGNGISKNNCNTIFEPFFTTNRAAGGMGLGLSITQNLVVTKLSGSIKIDSDVNKYTKFIVSLPSEATYVIENNI